MLLEVLVEQNVWAEFRASIEALGDGWTAPSGRVYRLALQGRRLEVFLDHPALETPPPQDLIDGDLLALAGRLYDAVRGEWSSEALHQTAQAWGWEVGR
jgi:hypothetical protein